MYAVDPPLPVEELPSGAYLVAGPAMSYKYHLIRSLLRAGLDAEEGALFVSTNKGTTALSRDFGWENGPPPEVGVVDCISQESSGDDRPNVAMVSSPGDLTGIGMYVSAQLSRLNERMGFDRVRMALYTVSTLLMYEEFQTVLRFTNVLGHRLQHAGALGLLALNTGSHDRQVVDAVTGVVDGVIEVRERDGTGETRVRTESRQTDWRAF